MMLHVVRLYQRWRLARIVAMEHAFASYSSPIASDRQEELDRQCDNLADDLLWQIMHMKDDDPQLDVTIRELRNG